MELKSQDNTVLTNNFPFFPVNMALMRKNVIYKINSFQFFNEKCDIGFFDTVHSKTKN